MDSEVVSEDLFIDTGNEFEYSQVGRSQSFVLYADSVGNIKIENIKTGVSFTSCAEDYDNDKLAEGRFKKTLASGISISYYDEYGNIKNEVSKDVAQAEVEKIENGINVVYTFSKFGFKIPVEYTVTETGFKASVIAKDIKETSKFFSLGTINLLPAFAAADNTHDGYIMVPDGSGAIIDLNQTANPVFDYSSPVFGRDNAIPYKLKRDNASNVRMPVIGMKRSDGGFCAIVTNSAASAIVNASLSGVKRSYSSAFFGFNYRSSDTVQMNSQAWDSRMISVINENREHPDEYTVEYYLTEEEKSEYYDMAAIYRQYLINAEQIEKNNSPRKDLVIEFLGGVHRQENILGIPVDKVIPLTTSDDINDAISDFSPNLNMSVVLSLYTKNADNYLITNNFTPDGEITGKSSFKKMLSNLKDKNIDINMNLNLTDMIKDSNAVFTLGKIPLTNFPFKPSTFQEDKSMRETYLLTPSKIKTASENLSKKASEYPELGAAAFSLGSNLYSDFNAKNHSSREESMKIWQEVFKNLFLDKKIVFSNANSYAFPYASLITDVPLHSSKNLMFTKDIPFYQIVLHGYIPYTIPSANQYFDTQTYFLKSIETGSAMKYLFAKRNLSKLQYTSLQEYDFVEYDKHWNNANSYSLQNKQELQDVSNESIISHKEYTSGVFCTEYSNGTKIYVNYNEHDVKLDINGQTIEKQSYLITDNR